MSVLKKRWYIPVAARDIIDKPLRKGIIIGVLSTLDVMVLLYAAPMDEEPEWMYINNLISVMNEKGVYFE